VAAPEAEVVMPKSLLVRLLMPCLAAMPLAAAAQAPAGDIRAEIAKKLEVSIEDVRPSPVPGLYEVSSGMDIGYVSADGRFYIDGDVFDIATRANLTDNRRQASRAALIKGVRDDQAIVFSPKGYQHTVNVFTDIDCGYCRTLHAEIAELNRLGVRVRYLLYPRGGPGSESWAKAEAVWCSADRNDALTRAKRGEQVTAAKCATPVASQFELGRELGIRGTPGIITERGDYIPGYLPAPRLLERLRQLEQG
jgi:thiol:disulfide interchange protein DsbC